VKGQNDEAQSLNCDLVPEIFELLCKHRADMERPAPSFNNGCSISE